jgi:hypothetical protein
MKFYTILLTVFTCLTVIAEESVTKAKDVYLDAFSEIYKLGLNELADEEKKAREESPRRKPSACTVYLQVGRRKILWIQVFELDLRLRL